MSEAVMNGAATGALPVSVKDRERFVPPHYLKDGQVPEDRPIPTYILAPLSLAERRTLNRIVIGMCGMFVSTGELRDALREAAIADWSEEQAAEVATTIEALEQFANATERDESVEAMMTDYRAKLSR